MESQRVPNIRATRLEVGGTVDSQRKPVTAPNTIAAAGLAGRVMKATTATARPKENAERMKRVGVRLPSQPARIEPKMLNSPMNPMVQAPTSADRPRSRREGATE